MSTTILNQLSSQVGDRSESANHQVALQCQEHPELLAEIAQGLSSKEAARAGDCAEVITQVALEQPHLVAPYAGALTALLNHKNTRARWESAHALALIAALTPETIQLLLPTLAEKVRRDPSIIVRDYAVDILAGYAFSGATAAREAFPLLKEALAVWGGRHAGHALLGLVHVASTAPELRAALCEIAQEYSQSEKGVVRKAAKALQRAARE